MIHKSTPLGFTFLGFLALGGTAMAQTEAFKSMAQPTELTINQTVVGNLKLPQGDTPENNRVTRYIKDTLNITINHAWEVTGDQADQKVDLAITSGKIPDAMTVNAKQLKQLVDAGMVEDLTSYYTKYASKKMKFIHQQTDGEALSRATFGGKLYAIPGVQKDGDSVPLLWIRADWLKKLGLSTPKSLSDLEKVADAFVNKDPDGNGKKDTVGIAASKEWRTRLAPLFNAYQSYPGAWLTDKQGNITYGSIQKETRVALQGIANLYKKGLIDPEFPTLSEDKLVEKISSGKAGMLFGPWWSSDWPLKFTLQNIKGADWVPVLAPLASDGKYHATFVPTTGRFLVVRKGYKAPEAVIKLANLQVEYENPEKNTKYINYDDVKDAIAPWNALWPSVSTTRVDWLPYHANRILAALKKNTSTGLNPHEKGVFKSIQAATTNPTADTWGFATAWQEGVPLLGSKLLVKHRESYRARDEIAESRVWSILQKTEDQNLLSIITGQQSINAFDAFQQNWLQQGGKALTDTINQ